MTEIDHVPVEVRTRAGDIILTCALIQQQLAELFAHIVGLNPAIFTYLGHDLDTSKMITAIKRLAKSDDCPSEVDTKLISTLNQCAKVLQERNNVAHGPMVYVNEMLMRFEVKGGEKPHRVAQGLSIAYFDKTLGDAKAALWALRQQVIQLNKRKAQQQAK
ncbi:hypothetical protein G7A66_13335 [Altererythrobacter sp. SALINAS58]|uniref:hypothetical protein n=1 Tax=Alteripontixanthobacter muriae TaxID=2705546 RepID=UPI00157555ED|nr:hypothetical protein [Alteripontixanthobacter muriae]NTZ44043.1 hypothetical protein [Alteripontixanthobacter muriae]